MPCTLNIVTHQQFDWNEEEREHQRFTMVTPCWRCFPESETEMKPALRGFISSSSIRCGRAPDSSPKSSPAPSFPPAPSSPARATTSSRERERPSQRASQFPLGQGARSTGLAKDPPPDPVSALRRPPPPRGQGELRHLAGRATSATSRPMDPPPADDSSHGAAGRGGKSGKSRGRLGLKKPSPTPTAPTPTTTAPSPTLTAPASRPPVSWSPAAPAPTPTAPTPTPTAPAPGQAPGSFPALTCPPQGARWGSIPPNFAQDPNSWYDFELLFQSIDTAVILILAIC